MLVTMTARLVRSHGKDEIPLPGSGRIEYRPAVHGTYQGALRGTDTVVAKITEGVAEPVELTPGPWRVMVRPDHGTAWESWLIELTEGMDEPVDLVDLAPVIVVDGEKWTVGPPGASVVGGRDNGDGTVSFELSDDTFTEPVVLPPGPAGRGIVSVSDPDAESRVTITYTDGSTSTVQAIQGAQGEPGEKGEPGEPGADSTVPGPAGPPGQVLTPGSMLVVGPGRPDAPTTTGMTSAALAALPVGCEYRSTDGASVGAWVWQKRPAGWVVTEGDTGWRSIPLGAPYSAGTAIRVRRTTELVYAAHGTPQLWTQWDPGIAKNSGIVADKAWESSSSRFMPDHRTIAPIFNGADGAIVGAVGWSTEVNGFVGLTHTASSGMVFELQAACTRAWPTTLP